MKKIYISAALIALICALAVFLVLKKQNDEISQARIEVEQAAQEKRESTTEIVVASADIPRGTILSADMLATIETDRAILVSIDALTSIDDAVGRQTLRDLDTNEAITEDILRNSSAGRGELSYSIPDGMYAIQIAVTNDSSVAGHIEEGDTVDIACKQNCAESPDQTGNTSSSQPQRSDWEIILENVRVLRLGDRFYDMESEYAYVIIATDREGIIKTLNSQSDGELKLVLCAQDTYTEGSQK